MKSLIQNKKGISTMIEYVLLIVIVMTMSGIVYVWMKTYIPKSDIECQEGVSIYLSNLKCSSVDGKYLLNLTIKNSGRFNLRGFFIRGTEEISQEVANIDLSNKLLGGNSLKSEIIFVGIGDENNFEPTKEEEFSFILDSPIYILDLIPTRLEDIDGKVKLALCGNEKISEKVSCN
jgi:hypothetical protein